MSLAVGLEEEEKRFSAVGCSGFRFAVKACENEKTGIVAEMLVK